MNHRPSVALSEQQLRDALRSEYLWLADLLDGAGQDVWLASSLCAGWTVREVVAHLSMPARRGILAVAAGVLRHRGDFNAYADRAAKRDGGLPTNELVNSLREPHLHAWTPPGGGLNGALVHTVVHSCDIAQPLAQVHHRSPDVQRAVLDNLSTPRTRKFFNYNEHAQTLIVEGLEWSFGTGPLLITDADTAITHLAGRPLG
jgi:uncharacterized protein (TIGR03083 family)